MIKSPCCGAKVEFAVVATLHYHVNPKTGRIAMRHHMVHEGDGGSAPEVVCTKCGTFYYASIVDGVVVEIEECAH